MDKLVEKATLLDENGYCTFSGDFWAGAEISLDELANLAIPKGGNVGISDALPRSSERRALVGKYHEGTTSFYSRLECPISNPSVIQNYCETLSESLSIVRLMSNLSMIAPSSTVGNPDNRFLIEFISKRESALFPLPAHSDGSDFLFLLCLRNDMIGGDMFLYQRSLTAPAVFCVEDGVRFYGEECVNCVETLSCTPGNGYMISEIWRKNNTQILHGCDGWVKTTHSFSRDHLRVSISTPQRGR